MPPKSSSKKSLRALEMLDKHISKRSSKNNEQSKKSLPWIRNKSPSNIVGNKNTNNNISKNQNHNTKTGPRSQYTIKHNNNDSNYNDESPTPKRRKTVTEEKVISKQLFNPNALDETEDEDDNNLNSSPIKKSVAFSDQIEIESSPIKKSSNLTTLPTRLPHTRQSFNDIIASSPKTNKSPPKSILKNKTKIGNPINVSKTANTEKSKDNFVLNNEDSQLSINQICTPEPTNKDNSTLVNNSSNNTVASTSPHLNDNFRNTNFVTYEPSQIEYWSSGEIHNLFENKNVTEFKNIIDGGLSILQQDSYPYNERRFEIYATFNNIISSVNMRYTRELNDKKIDVLIENFSRITKICIPHWYLTQQQLLQNDITDDNGTSKHNTKPKNTHKNKTKKKDNDGSNQISDDKNSDNDNDNDNPMNPFVSRLYNQIVKFFTKLLSNFRIVKWLANNKSLQSEIKTVYQYSLKALTDIRSNKPILISNLTFLKDEKFYTYYATRPEIVELIHAIPLIKTINSQNYMLEKLHYVNSLLLKFPDLMIKHMNIWLYGDLLPQIIIEHETYFEKLSVASISILLDLLKKIYDTSNTSIKELYSTIVYSPIKKTLPPKYFEKIKHDYLNVQSIPNDVNIYSVTLETLLFHYIIYLLQSKGAYKIAMDLWLILVGILFSNAVMIQTFISIPIKMNKWLILNKIAFESNSNNAKILALKSWRILIYQICMNLHKFSVAERNKCYEILNIPFSMSQSVTFSKSVLTGISFVTKAITYTIACYFHNSKLPIETSSTLFYEIWNELLSPSFTQLLSMRSPNHELQKLIVDIIINLLGENTDTKHVSSSYDGNSKGKSTVPRLVIPIKVIATGGISLNEIPSLPKNLQNLWYPEIKDFATKVIREHGEDTNCLVLLRTLINVTPETQINSTTFMELTGLLYFYLENLCHVPMNSTDIFYTLSFNLFLKFAPLLFREEDKNLANYLGHFKTIKFNNNDVIVRLLKDIIKSTRNQVPELLIFYKFLDVEDEQCHNYTVNWLSSTLLSATMDYKSFQVLTCIIESIPEPCIIDNFLTVFPRMEQSYLDIVFSKCLSWPLNSLLYFIKGCLSTNDARLLNFTMSIIKEILHSQSPLVFNTLLPILHAMGMTTFIQECLLECPSLLETMKPNIYPYVYKDSKQSLLPFFIKNISQVSNENKIYILDRLLKEEGLVSVLTNFELFSSVLFESSNDIPTDDQKKMILKLLTRSYEEMKWDVFSTVVEQTLHSTNINYVEMFFYNHNAKVYEIMNHFPINLIVNLYSNGGKIDGLIDQAIIQMLKYREVDFVISLIRAFLNSKKSVVLNKLADTVVSSLFNDTPTISEIQKNKKLKLFRDILTKGQNEDSDLLVNILNSVISLFPITKSDFKMELLESISKVLGKESDKPHKFHQVDQIVSELDKMRVLNFEVSQSPEKNGTQLTLFTSSEEFLQNAQNQVENKSQIQVPATQKSDRIQQNVATKAILAYPANDSTGKGKIITSSYSISYDEANSLERDKNNINPKSDIKKQTELGMATSTQVGSIRVSVQSLLDVGNGNKKVKDLEEIPSSLPEEINNGKIKLVGTSDISSTIEEIDRLSQINKGKEKSTQNINPGIDIHKIFQSTKNTKLPITLAAPTDNLRPLSSPFSKKNNIKNVNNASSFSSPIKRNLKTQPRKLEELSQRTSTINTPNKQQKMEKIDDDHMDSSVNNNPSIMCNLLTEANTLSELQSEMADKGIKNVNMKTNDIQGFVDDVQGNTTSQEKNSSHSMANQSHSGGNENELVINEKNVERYSSLEDNGVEPDSNIANKSRVTTNDSPHQPTNENGEEENSDVLQQISTESSKVISTEVVPDQPQVKANGQQDAVEANQLPEQTIEQKEKSDSIKFNTALNATNNCLGNDVQVEGYDNEGKSEVTQPLSVKEVDVLKRKENNGDRVSGVKEGETNTIRIPIFNSLKLHEKQTSQRTTNNDNMNIQPPTPKQQPVLDNQNHLLLSPKNNSNIGGNDIITEAKKSTEKETTKRNEQIEDDEFLQDSFMLNSEEDHQKESQETGIEGISRETTPSLRSHFPSKKTRKLVSRLHNFSAEDLAAIPIAERRNLRVELLDFMMKLEYYNTDEI